MFVSLRLRATSAPMWRFLKAGCELNTIHWTVGTRIIGAKLWVTNQNNAETCRLKFVSNEERLGPTYNPQVVESNSEVP
jgi:hypothetical protein